MARLTEAQEERVEGYIIQHPEFPRSSGYHTFGRTMIEAWERHSPANGRDAGEMAAVRGRWAEKGFRPLAATLVIHASPLLSERARGDGE